MFRRKKKAAMLAAQEKSLRITLAEQPKLPSAERAFFDMLLQALSGGLLELAHAAKQPQEDELLRKCAQTRGTVAYAQALLRLEQFAGKQDSPEELLAVLNTAINRLRREFLYAGVALRRPPDDALQGDVFPHELTAFLLEEMITCCLRCAPEGKHLHMAAKRIDNTLLLSMRSEGRTQQLPPLIPPLGEDKSSSMGYGDADYGFAMCRAIASMAGWEFRWEADEAGIRMFLDIKV